MKRVFMLIYATIFYLVICFTDMLFYKIPLIPHMGFSEYTIMEKCFFFILIAVSVIITAFMLNRDNIKEFFINFALLLVTYLFLNNVVNVRFLVSMCVPDFETFAFGPNFLSQDIWFSHYLGCFIGVIVAGCIVLIKISKHKGFRSDEN